MGASALGGSGGAGGGVTGSGGGVTGAGGGVTSSVGGGGVMGAGGGASRCLSDFCGWGCRWSHCCSRFCPNPALNSCSSFKRFFLFLAQSNQLTGIGLGNCGSSRTRCS